jgi:8-oxo-dGTP diphosphatase
VKLQKVIDVINLDGTQYFFKAEIVSGTIGSGEGEEYTNTERGSYEPMFIPVATLHKLQVFPKEIAEKVQTMGETVDEEMEDYPE